SSSRRLLLGALTHAGELVGDARLALVVGDGADQLALAVQLAAGLLQGRVEAIGARARLPKEGGEPGVLQLRFQLEQAELCPLHLHAQLNQADVERQQPVLDPVTLPDHASSKPWSAAAPIASVTRTESSTNCVMAASSSRARSCCSRRRIFASTSPAPGE